MIKLHVLHGEAFVWNAEDVNTLRTKHRIMGTMVGCLPRLPNQNKILGLPMQLMREEATLLAEKGIAELVERLERTPTDDDGKDFALFRHQSFQQQSNLCREERKRMIMDKADIIVQGKMKKWKASNKSGVAGEPKSAEQILKDEIDKIPRISPSQAMVQIFTESPWETQCSKAKWQFPQNDDEKLRYLTFKNLWELGYFLTPGLKFGGDFLVYTADPACSHAEFIAVCKPLKSNINWFDVLVKGRLANSVKKSVVICSLDDKDEVLYCLQEWKYSH